MQFITYYHSPLGKITLSSDGKFLTGLWLDGQKYFASTLGTVYEENETLQIFKETQAWLNCYFHGQEPDFTPALFPQGTPFRVSVWNILRQIPYGETITYKEIADKIAQLQGVNNMSAQAVGGAVGHNPISIIIPCHRVIGTYGSLTGYAGGIANKIKLLELEGVDTSRFSIPLQGTAL